MWEAIIRTFFLVVIMELGSTSQFAVAALASHSQNPFMVWLAALGALTVTTTLAVLGGSFLSKLPIEPEIISGIMMILIGAFLLCKH